MLATSPDQWCDKIEQLILVFRSNQMVQAI